MSEEAYRRLSRQLDAIPNGFPPAESGADLRLLKKLFTPEEAALAAHMTSHREPAASIAARAGLDPQAALTMLKAMARRELIRVGRQEGQLTFGLSPFIVGFYEGQLARFDRELAELFEAYFTETGGVVAHWAPAVHRIIPVEEAVPAGIEFYAYERASALLESAQAWAVRDCICRVQQKLLGKGCDRPMESCIAFGPVPGMFDGVQAMRSISSDEALKILREAEDAGLVHSPGNYRDGHFYICNCCTCCCGVLRSVAEFGLPTAIARADFVAVLDEELCAACGECLDRCQFGALSLSEGFCQVDAGRCVGCGLCVTTCAPGALHLERRPPGEVLPPPANVGEWLTERAHARGLEGW
ncbi:MAG: 4Fe-4S ferredoxin [Chloroflexi bacterium]|nr:MAG: 4Fe-4S ferredoxin [Chloroflexota bacterium]